MSVSAVVCTDIGVSAVVCTDKSTFAEQWSLSAAGINIIVCVNINTVIVLHLMWLHLKASLLC